LKELLELFNAMSADERDAFCAKVRKLLGKGKFSESRLRGVVSSGRSFGPVLCVALESASGGKITRKMLRPDDYKMYWPELKRIA
jgi:DNA-binding transcriptional regulator YdaS (Cro superfamily)